MGKRVLTFGEVLLRLSPPGRLRLEQASSLEVHVGGAELNVAAALSRLGVPASILTALPPNHLGKLAAGMIRKAGVDGSLILWREKGRMGLYFLEFGSDPRPSQVLYDRAGSAASMLKPEDIDWKRVLEGFDHFHTTGITPALSRGCLHLVKEGLAQARKMGITTSFDFNYRSLLWSREQARRSLTPILTNVNHLILSPGDSDRILGIKEKDPVTLARRLSERFECSSVALTLREEISVTRTRWAAISWDGERLHEDRFYELEAEDRIGSGDAFAAGYIYGVLAGDIQLGLRMGNAMAALKHSVPGDILYFDASEVMDLIKSETTDHRIRR